MTTKCMAGIDLHSKYNLFCAIVDMDGKRVFEKRLACDLPTRCYGRRSNRLRNVWRRLRWESTYNWYWLVDGLQ